MEENERTTPDLREQLAAAFADDGVQAAQAVEAEAPTAPETPVDNPVPTQEAQPRQTEEQPAVNPTSEVPAQNSAPGNAGADAYAMAMQMANRATEALRAMQQENARLRETMEQQSRQAETAAQAVVENTAPQMPVFDVSNFAYIDDEGRQKAAADFTQRMAEFMRTQMEGELAPIKESFEAQKAAAAKAEAINRLSSDARMTGFADAIPQIEHILAKTPSVGAEKNPEMRYALGYIIKRGLDSMHAPAAAEKSAADIAKEAMANPEVMRLIESERARATAEKNAGAVAQAASSGSSGAPAAPQPRPTSMAEAKELFRRTFGL